MTFLNTRMRILLPLACACAAGAQTRVDLRTQGKGIDFSAASSTKPSKTGTALPPTCSVGEEFFKTDAPAGQNKFGCTGANTWSQLAGIVNFPGQLGNDFVTTGTSTVLTTQAGARAFGTLRVASAACGFTITAGTINGLAYEYLTDSGQVVLAHPAGAGSLSLSVTGFNCQATAVPVPGWPSGVNFHPIATIAIENGRWGAITAYPSLSAGWYVVCAANLDCSYSDGLVVVDTGANVMLAAAANLVTGSLDLSGAQFLNVPRGATDPAQCQGGMGALFYNTATGTLKTCTAIAPPTWTTVISTAGAVTGNNLAAGHLVAGGGGSTIVDSGVPAANLWRSDADVVLQNHKWDARQASQTLPARTGNGTPAGRDACTVGEAYFQADASPGLNQWVCSSADTWTNLGASAPALTTFTTITTVEFPAAVCQAGTAYLTGSVGGSGPPGACLAGSNNMQAAAQFTPGGPSLQYRLVLPDDWTTGSGNDIEFLFASPASGGTGQVAWKAQTACAARTGAGLDPAWNAAQTAAAAALDNGLSNAVTLSGWNATGCAAGRFLYLNVALDGSTTSAGNQNLFSVRLKLRRTVTTL